MLKGEVFHAGLSCLRGAELHWRICELEAGASLALVGLTRVCCWVHTSAHAADDTWRCAGIPRHRDSKRWAGGPNLRIRIQAGGCPLTWAMIHLASLLRTEMRILHETGIQVHHGTTQWASVSVRSLPHADRRVKAGQLALVRHFCTSGKPERKKKAIIEA